MHINELCYFWIINYSFSFCMQLIQSFFRVLFQIQFFFTYLWIIQLLQHPCKIKTCYNLSKSAFIHLQWVFYPSKYMYSSRLILSRCRSHLKDSSCGWNASRKRHHWCFKTVEYSCTYCQHRLSGTVYQPILADAFAEILPTYLKFFLSFCIT